MKTGAGIACFHSRREITKGTGGSGNAQLDGRLLRDALVSESALDR